jgi:hypothetical protein
VRQAQVIKAFVFTPLLSSPLLSKKKKEKTNVLIDVCWGKRLASGVPALITSSTRSTSNYMWLPYASGKPKCCIPD